MAGVDDLVTALKGGLQTIGQFVAQQIAPGMTLSSVVSPTMTVVTTLTTASLAVIGPSTVRRGMIFHNPTPAGVNYWLSPTGTAAVANRGILLVPGDHFLIGPTLSPGAGWNAIAASGSGNVIVILEYF